MANVEDRIVSMQFDNRSFEQRISGTLSSLDKLKRTLNFNNENRNLQELQRAGAAFNLEGIGRAVDNISSRFSAMGAVAFSVISNITNRAVDAGIRIGRALTIGPLMDGFSEYETNMNSIQTILSNTRADGTNLEQVNDALQKLNVYSDQTIYNFSQMARNIGTFTAAGVGLDDSVNAIKGIANLAAISGSNADQASTAMYQLSQALSAGKVSLMDWNSVVNAGMGGEVFKKALFETGKALGTINDVPLGATFEEWEKKGGTFREQMEKGWITADVLKTTLGAFSGDLDAATLKTMGFTDAQAAEMIELGKMGVAAATEVKTLRQLMSTVKESIASGWSQSFKLIFGDFEEAKQLFTGLNNAIGGFVGRMSDARNNLLQGWKELGGRDKLIDALGAAFGVVARILDRLGKAFREIFPAMTAQRLYDLTVAFGAFMERLQAGGGTLEKLQRIFAGVFAVLEIGWEVVKNVARVIGELLSALNRNVGGGALEFFANMGDSLVSLNAALVTGGGIRAFFDDILSIFGIFSGSSDGVGDAVGRLGDRFGWFGSVLEAFGTVFQAVADRFDTIREVFQKAFEAIGTMFQHIGDRIAEAMQTGNFDEVFDVINTGLIGGILLILRRFMKNGFKFFSGGIFTKLSQTFEQLTGVLQAMQTKLKAEALFKIAAAIGILAASLVVLSLIDSAALTKALTAMGIAFGQLIAVMALLQAANFGVKSAATMTLLAAAMIALSTAVLTLSAAVKVFSTMSWGELVKGLLGVGAVLAAITLAARLMPDGKALISTGIGLAAIAVAVRVLANAVEAMSRLSWEDMIQGLTGVAVALGALVLASRLMNPAGMLAAGAGMLGLAIGLNILTGAIAILGKMDILTMVQGLAGVGAALLIVAAAMHAMPLTLPLTGAGLVLVGVGLTAIAGALKIVASMDMAELGKGLLGIAGALGILAIAANAMTGTLAGSASILIAATALSVLTKTVKRMADMSWGEIAKGLGGIAASLVLLGLAAAAITPSLPSLVALGAALLLIGAGFALFGIGAAGVANALKLIADTGAVAIEALRGVLELIIAELPGFAVALAEALVKVADEILSNLPQLLEHLGEILVTLFQELQESIPELIETFAVIILALLESLTTHFPAFVAKGFELLMQLLNGILLNIAQVTTMVVRIVVTFLNTLAFHMPMIVAAGLNLLVQFLLGIANNIQKVIDAGFMIITKIIEGVGNGLVDVINAGGDAVIKFIEGIEKKSSEIVDAGVDAVLSFLEGVGKNALELANGAAEVIVEFLEGLAQAIRDHSEDIRNAGLDVASALLSGMTFGLSDGIGGVVGTLTDGLIGGIGGALDAVGGFLGIGGPSRVFCNIGKDMMLGMVDGVEKQSGSVETRMVRTMGDLLNSVNSSMSAAALSVTMLEDINPTIAPVVDLSNVESSASKIRAMMSDNAIAAAVSFDQARVIALATDRQNESESQENKPPDIVREVKFEQNIHAPTQLSAGEIYRNTRTQFALAREELAKAP